MPGLIDAHVHVLAQDADLSRTDQVSTTDRILHAKHMMEAALSRGFTAFRDAGGADFTIAEAVENDLIKGPRLYYSGFALSQTGGHGDFRINSDHLYDTCACSYSGAISSIADGVDEVRKAAREQLRLGATQVKLMASGGVMSPSDPIWMVHYSDNEIAAAVEEARRRRTYVMAQAYTGEAISRIVQLGVRTVEHGNLIDADGAKLVKQNDAFVVPTLSTYYAMQKKGQRLD